MVLPQAAGVQPEVQQENEHGSDVAAEPGTSNEVAGDEIAEVPHAIPEFISGVVAGLHRCHHVPPSSLMGIMKVEGKEAIVVRTTMASLELGVSPTAFLATLSSGQGMYGKGERKYRFKIPGGTVQHANCAAIYACCLPDALVLQCKTLIKGQWDLLCMHEQIKSS